MARYHITAKGEPALCRAVKNPCPLGGEHFSTAAEARKSFEASNETFNTIDVASEKDFATLSENYRMNHSAPIKDDDDFNKPLHELDQIFPKDVYDHPDWYGQQYDETLAQIKKARSDPKAVITIYRAVPKHVNEIHPGDWVALSYEYALGESYGAEKDGSDGKVIKYEVPAKVLYTDANSLEEWGFSGNQTLKGWSTK